VAKPQSPYAFEIRFGGPAIEHGVVAIPRVVIDHYAHLGLRDAEMMWIVHLLAYKWTEDDPYPKRSRLRCSANADTQSRYARHLRKLGLLFTYRRYYVGRVICLGYDFNSLVHNCVRLHNLLEQRTDEYLAEYDTDVPPGETEHRKARDEARGLVMNGVVVAYEMELPPDVLANLKAGKYDDVPPSWTPLVEVAPATPAPPPDEPEPGENPDAEEELTAFLGPRIAVPVEAFTGTIATKPIKLVTKGDNGGDGQRSFTVPVQAGGSHGPAEAIVDGICRYNGLTDGIEALPRKKRTSWVRQIAKVLKEWEDATVDQARLAWQAWTVRYSWRPTCTPFYRTWESEFGPLLVGVRDGSITEESLRRELDDGGQSPDPAAYGEWFEDGDQDEYLRRCEAAQSLAQATEEVPRFWREALHELLLQMTEGTFDAHLRNTTARVDDDGSIVVLAANDNSLVWLERRLADDVRRTLARLVPPDTPVRFAVRDPSD
jgi:hypothetical protein